MNLLSEMVFGTVAMTYRGSSFKVSPSIENPIFLNLSRHNITSYIYFNY